MMVKSWLELATQTETQEPVTGHGGAVVVREGPILPGKRRAGLLLGADARTRYSR